MSFTPESKRVPGQCDFPRCRQEGTLVFHLEGDRLEACEKHEIKAGELMLAESKRRNPEPKRIP